MVSIVIVFQRQRQLLEVRFAHRLVAGLPRGVSNSHANDNRQHQKRRRAPKPVGPVTFDTHKLKTFFTGETSVTGSQQQCSSVAVRRFPEMDCNAYRIMIQSAGERSQNSLPFGSMLVFGVPIPISPSCPELKPRTGRRQSKVPCRESFAPFQHCESTPLLLRK